MKGNKNNQSQNMGVPNVRRNQNLNKDEKRHASPTCEHCGSIIKFIFTITHDYVDINICRRCFGSVQTFNLIPYKGKMIGFDELPATKDSLYHLRDLLREK